MPLAAVRGLKRGIIVFSILTLVLAARVSRLSTAAGGWREAWSQYGPWAVVASPVSSSLANGTEAALALVDPSSSSHALVQTTQARGGQLQHRTVLGVAPVRDLIDRTKRALAGFWRRVRAILPKMVKRRSGQTCEESDGPSSPIANKQEKDGPVASPFTVDPYRAILSNLTPQQMEVVRKAHTEVIAVPGLVARGAKVGMVINEEMVARYLVAWKWDVEGRGHTVRSLIEDTVRWREEEGIDRIPASEVLDQAANGYLYVRGADKAGRPLIYFRPAYMDNSVPDRAVRCLIYTLERALSEGRRRSPRAEAYSLIIDFTGFSHNTVPPIRTIKLVFHLLRHHYPTRVGFIALLNTGTAFQLLWRVLAPLVSPLTRGKISFVSRADQATDLLRRVDATHLEEIYGGADTYKFSPATYFPELKLRS